MKFHANEIEILEFSEDGKFLASSDKKHTVIIWKIDQETGKLKFFKKIAKPDYTKFPSMLRAPNSPKSIRFSP